MQIIRTTILLGCIFAAFFASAQNSVGPDSISSKPRTIENTNTLNINTLPFDNPAFVATNGLPNIFSTAPPLLPDFNSMLGFDNSPKLFITNTTSWQPAFSPFIAGSTIFNRAEYHTNSKFVYGGNSFGAKTIFDPMKALPQEQNMSIKGASMFMQYKVSKNFKIETRVSVATQPTPWLP